MKTNSKAETSVKAKRSKPAKKMSGEKLTIGIDHWPMRNAVAVQSSLLATVAYHSRRSILQVAFRNGVAYQYTGVPADIYQGLLRADSKGAYFNRRIRDLYPYELLTQSAASN